MTSRASGSPTEPRLSPDGRFVVVSLQTVAPDHTAYRNALWLVPTDAAGGAPRQVTLGARHDGHARFSPDGRTLAFLSDRRVLLEEEPDRPTEAKDREDVVQVHLLPLDGGEARRLTDLPRGVSGFEWSPDGTRMVVTSSSHEPTRERDLRRRGLDAAQDPGAPPPSDYRYVDRLDYMLNGAGFVYDRVPHLWLVDVATGDASRLTDGPVGDHEPAWSPDGTRIAFVSNRRRDYDLHHAPGIHVIDVATRAIHGVAVGRKSYFGSPAWIDDETIVALGARNPRMHAGVRNDIWRFAADGSDATPNGGQNLSARHDLMPAAGMVSDVTPGESARLIPTADGSGVLFAAPIQGAYELWRLALADSAVERLTTGRHYISSFDAIAGPRGRERIAFLRSSPTEPGDVWLLDGRGEPRRLSAFNADALADLSCASRRIGTPRSTVTMSRAGSYRPATALGRWWSSSTVDRTRCMAGRRSGSSRSSPPAASGSTR